MMQAAFDFYDMEVEGDNLFFNASVEPVQFRGIWHLYPDMIWGRECIGLGHYYENFDGNVDFYYQTRAMMWDDLFHKIVVYGISSPNDWWRGERYYDRTVQMPEWRRPPFSIARL